MKIPVLLTIFNRKDTALEALKSIKAYQPEKLYIAADGPRTHKEGEEQACADTRQAVMDAIDWPCQVQTLFREENLGCAWAMYGAISWFLEQEEWKDLLMWAHENLLLCRPLCFLLTSLEL